MAKTKLRENVNRWFSIMPILLFPSVLMIGVLTIPLVSDYSKHILAEQAVSQTARWFWGHLISAVAFGFASLAAYSIHQCISKREQSNLSIVSLSLIAIGGVLYACGLGADGIGPLAIMAGGGSAFTFFDGSGMWVSGVFIAASVLFGSGLIVQVISLIHAGILKGLFRIMALFAAIVFIGATAIPSGWGLYWVAVAVLVLYGLLVKLLWREYFQKNKRPDF